MAHGHHANPNANGTLGNQRAEILALRLEDQLDLLAKQLVLERQRGDLLETQNVLLRAKLAAERPAHAQPHDDVPLQENYTGLQSKLRSLQEKHDLMLEEQEKHAAVQKQLAILEEKQVQEQEAYVGLQKRHAILQEKHKVSQDRVQSLEEERLQLKSDVLRCSPPTSPPDSPTGTLTGRKRITSPTGASSAGENKARRDVQEELESVFQGLAANDRDRLMTAISGKRRRELLRSVGKGGSTLLHQAILSGHKDLAESVLDAIQKQVKEALHSVEVQSDVIKHQVWQVVNRRDGAGCTPLLLHCRAAASDEPSEAVCLKLLAIKADPCITGGDGAQIPPFLECARLGHVGLMKCFLRHAPHSKAILVGQVDDVGRSALHHAAEGGMKLSAALLLQLKADARAMDEQGRTPLQVALAGDHKVVAELLAKETGEKLHEEEEEDAKGADERKAASRSSIDHDDEDDDDIEEIQRSDDEEESSDDEEGMFGAAGFTILM